jgi:hypothetical protein
LKYIHRKIQYHTILYLSLKANQKPRSGSEMILLDPEINDLKNFLKGLQIRTWRSESAASNIMGGKEKTI